MKMKQQVENKSCKDVTLDREWLDNVFFPTLSQQRVDVELGISKTGFFVEYLEWFTQVYFMLPANKGNAKERELAQKLAQVVHELHSPEDHSWLQIAFSDRLFNLYSSKALRHIAKVIKDTSLANEIRKHIQSGSSEFRRETARQMGVLCGDLKP